MLSSGVGVDSVSCELKPESVRISVGLNAALRLVDKSMAVDTLDYGMSKIT
jgi:hypothetical protein